MNKLNYEPKRCPYSISCEHAGSKDCEDPVECEHFQQLATLDHKIEENLLADDGRVYHVYR